MKKFELHITWEDWIFIIFIAVIFSSLISALIYESFNLSLIDGIINGAILGFCLALFSFSFITINNKFILPRIKSPFVWWIVSAFFSFMAGMTGFFLAFIINRAFDLVIPDKVIERIEFFAIISGILNYIVGLLIYLFVNMKSKKQELEILILESKILSLNSQLNTHFLFNTINSIIELMKFDTTKAERSLIKLSQFLRKVLKNKDLFTVQEELENVKNYIELENIRYGGLISLKIKNEEEFLNELVPKFSIQLIVENAIKHGFQRKSLNIEIIFEKIDNIMKIYVINDGKIPESINFGTGLSNLSKRMKLLCNGRIEYKTNQKTVFTLIMQK